MASKSIRPALDDAETAVTALCEHIQTRTNNPELRKEYHTLLNQVTKALNLIRSISETDDFINVEWPKLASKIKSQKQ